MSDAPVRERVRIESVDLLRGVIMVIMALDHTRDYFTNAGNPTNLATTTTALFFTRWITHFCAPGFFLLTGTGAYLSLRHKSKAELSRFLITRGLWLMLLEVVVMRFAYQFNFDYKVTFLIVIWTLGVAMIFLGLLVRLPVTLITVIGAVMIAGHNLLDRLKVSGPLWSVLHTPGFLIEGERTVFHTYPLIPWIGVTAVGYGLGQIYDWEPERRRKFLVRAGLAMIAAFVALRGLNMYGDPRPWSVQPTSWFTVLSFINTTKQAPSLLFLLMTLGPALLFLRAVDSRTPRALGPALTIGKVPLFYFITHFTLIHLLAVIVTYVRYGTAHWMFESPDLGNYPFTQPPDWGYGLLVVYLVWAVVVLLLYPLCRWYAGLKRRRNDWWLSYL
jgi:uncharacterized membrane protein